MNRRALEKLRDLIQPLVLPDHPKVESTFNAALATFCELVESLIAAEQEGIQVDMEPVLGMYGDLLVERDEVLRAAREPIRGA